MRQAPSRAANRPSAGPPGIRRLPLVFTIAVGAVALVAASVVWWLASDDGDAAPSTSTAVSTAMSTVPGPIDVPSPQRVAPVRAFESWPSPPIDHDPHVLSVPGNGALVADADGRTLIYVNSIGRPTVVDLETGHRQELEIAPTRRFDRFEVDAGRVVSVSGRDTSGGRAGPDAITVRVHRPQLFPFSPTSPATGIDLCLAAVCPQLAHVAADGADRTDRRIEVLATEADADLAQLLSGASGRDGRFDTVVVDGAATRIPTPGSGPIWTVRQS